MNDPFFHEPVSRETRYPVPQGTIQGAILCRIRDGYGEIVVAEEGNTRTLYFDAVVQSTIRTDRPELLLEDYNQAMMCALLFQGSPRSALMIGLGGGSLVHFLRKIVPDCALDVVEIRRQVIDLAREYFLLPREHALLRIVHDEDGDFLGRSGTGAGKYDLVIMDAFDDAGPATALYERSFLASCRTLLTRRGVFIANVWNGLGHRFSALYRSAQDAFDANTLKLLLSESCRNAIIFGFQDPAFCRDLLSYRTRARELKGRIGIDFPRYLRQLYWQNFNAQDQ